MFPGLDGIYHDDSKKGQSGSYLCRHESDCGGYWGNEAICPVFMINCSHFARCYYYGNHFMVYELGFSLKSTVYG